MSRQPSVLAKKFAPPKTKVQYPDEKPLVDLAVGGSKQNQARLTSFINTIAKNSPFGKAVLEDAAKAGYTLVMESQKGSCGFCDNERKVIALNPRLTDDLLIATLAHEGRHAQQFARGAKEGFGLFNVKCELLHSRAMEADAETAAAATCHEIKINSGNAGPWNDFAADSVTISEGFMTAAKTPDSKVTNDMLKGAFEGWYKDIPMVKAYEDGYIVDVMKQGLRHNLEDQLPYNEEISSKEVVNMFCLDSKGKCYWADKTDVLEDKEKLSISPETALQAERFFKVREMRNGKAPDQSYLQLTVRHNPVMEDKAAMSPKAALIAAQFATTRSPISTQISNFLAGKKAR